MTESTPNRYPCPSPDERQHSSRHIGHFWPIGLSATSTSLTRASASHPSSRGLPTYLTYYVFTVPPTGTRHTHWLGTASFLVLMDSSLPAARRSPANHHHHPLSRKERKDSSLPFAIGFLFFYFLWFVCLLSRFLIIDRCRQREIPFNERASECMSE